MEDTSVPEVVTSNTVAFDPSTMNRYPVAGSKVMPSGSLLPKLLVEKEESAVSGARGETSKTIN